ncbi:MAG TPA: hypothetical protein VF476_13015 [Chitinophagaceae bacterium]
MASKFLYSILLFFSLSCKAQEEFSAIDTNIIAVLPIGEKASWFKSHQSFALTREEFKIIDSLLAACIKENNSRYSDTSNPRLNGYIYLDRYKRQYIPFIKNENRIVFINCFTDSFSSDWRKKIVDVDGGGRNYFNLFLNLATKSCHEFWINAPL